MTACPAGVPPWPCPYASDVEAEADTWQAYLADLRASGAQPQVADLMGSMGAQVCLVTLRIGETVAPAFQHAAAAFQRAATALSGLPL